MESKARLFSEVLGDVKLFLKQAEERNRTLLKDKAKCLEMV